MEKRTISLTQKIADEYRKKPAVACLDLLDIALNDYQRITIEESWNRKFPMWLMGRGCGKTFMGAVFLILRALLYPRTKIGIISSSYRQANFVFDAIDEIYWDSPLLQDACVKPSVRSNNQTILKFKNGSFIEALPIGDGKKIRGRRYHLVFLDEYAQIPESVIKLVIRPMLIVKKGYDPRKRGKEDSAMGNQTIIASTAYYRWNHLWKTKLHYEKQIANGDDNYIVLTFTADDALDQGLYDEAELKNQREDMEETDFLMEYYCVFPDDSAGWIRASMINNNEDEDIEPELVPDDKAIYVMGCDCARAAGGDNFALLTLKIVGRTMSVARIETLNGATFTEMGNLVRNRVNQFNPVLLFNDSGGGGLALKDELAKEGFDPEMQAVIPPVFDIEDENVDPDASGLHIMKMINFREVGLIHQMGVEVKKLLQQNKLKFPPNVIRFASEEDFLDTDEEIAMKKLYKEVMALKKELVMIRAIPNGNWFKFEMPTAGESGESKKNLHKDRWTALNLAVWAAKEWLAEGEVGYGYVGHWAS